VRGRVRRETARRRKSECKVNLLSRNSSRSNDSWRMSPKSTKYSAAAIGLRSGRRSDQWGSVINTRRPMGYNTLLIKTTHDSTPVCLNVVRMIPERNTWRMDLCQITVYDALRRGGGNMWTKVHHVAWKSLVRIFSLAPKLSGLRRCILSQFLNFDDYFFGGTAVQVVVCASKAWSICNA